MIELIVSLFFLLAIISIRTMLPVVMLFNEQWVHCQFRIDLVGNEGHLSTLFHYFGIVNGICRTCSPTEWTVVLNQYGRSMIGVDAFESFYNDVSGFQFVLLPLL